MLQIQGAMSQNSGNIVYRYARSPGSSVGLALAYWSRGPGFRPLQKWRSFQWKMGFHCTQPFIITCPASWYDCNTVKKDVKLQVVHPSVTGILNPVLKFMIDCKTLSIGTDAYEQTVQTQIRLLFQEQSDQGLQILPLRLHF